MSWPRSVWIELGLFWQAVAIYDSIVGSILLAWWVLT
jgi:hypothetical protein